MDDTESVGCTERGKDVGGLVDFIVTLIDAGGHQLVRDNRTTENGNGHGDEVDESALDLGGVGRSICQYNINVDTP